MTDLTALEEAAKKAADLFAKIKVTEYPENFSYQYLEAVGELGSLTNPSTILSLISTIRSLERERDEAFSLLRSTIAPMSAYPSDCRNAQEVHKRAERIKAFLAAIHAEAKGSGG